MPTQTQDVATFARWFDDTPRIREVFERYARSVAETSIPDYAITRDAAERAADTEHEAWREYRTADARFRTALDHYGRLSRVADPVAALADFEYTIAATDAELRATRDRVERLCAEPAVRAQPPETVRVHRDQWQIDRDAQAREQRHWTPVNTGVQPFDVSRGYGVPDFRVAEPSPHIGR